MANVSFGKGTLTLTGTTSSFPDGMIYFNTSSKKIYLNNGGTVVTFDGNNTDTITKSASGNTSSKIYLIGATSQSGTGVTTYSHDTAYVGADGYLYSGGYLVAPIRSRDVYGSTAMTSAASYSDTTTILSSNYGVILYVTTKQVGQTTNSHYYTGGTPTVTPGGGNNGPSYKITCTWTKKTGSGSTALLDGSPTYTIYYIPRNYT